MEYCKPDKWKRVALARIMDLSFSYFEACTNDNIAAFFPEQLYAYPLDLVLVDSFAYIHIHTHVSSGLV